MVGVIAIVGTFLLAYNAAFLPIEVKNVLGSTVLYANFSCSSSYGPLPFSYEIDEFLSPLY